VNSPSHGIFFISFIKAVPQGSKNEWEFLIFLIKDSLVCYVTAISTFLFHFNLSLETNIIYGRLENLSATALKIENEYYNLSFHLFIFSGAFIILLLLAHLLIASSRSKADHQEYYAK